MDFPGLQFACVWRASEWPCKNKHADCLLVSCCDFSEVYVKLSSFNLYGFGKRAVEFHSDLESKEWEKIGNITLEIHSQIFEETRIIQDPVQIIHI